MTKKKPRKTVADLARQEGSRRDAVIVFTDIVGSTQLKAESGDLETEKAFHRFRTVASRLVETHGGLTVKVLGDGAMMLFSDVENAVDFATTLQRALAKDPIRIVEEPLRIRVGLHAGPVQVMRTSYGEDAFGTVVNVAARLTDLAAPGQVVLSGTAAAGLRADRRRLLGPKERVVLKHGEQVEVMRIDVPKP